MSRRLSQRTKSQRKLSQQLDKIQCQTGFLSSVRSRSHKTSKRFVYMGWFLMGVFLIIISVLIYHLSQKNEKEEKKNKN